MTDPKSLDYQHIAVAEFMLKANQTVPIVPMIPSLEIRTLRAKLVLEEALETVNALGLEAHSDWELLDSDLIKFSPIKEGPDLIKLADGCADIKVVTVGTEIACGINGKPIFEEVMRSNMTKFIDGHMREDGKWQKGPSYEPPNLEPILKQQGMK